MVCVDAATGYCYELAFVCGQMGISMDAGKAGLGGCWPSLGLGSAILSRRCPLFGLATQLFWVWWFCCGLYG